METDEFARLAIDRFGDKVIYSGLVVNEVDLNLYNAENSTNHTAEHFLNYKKVWLTENKCPNCGTELLGLFGSFTWGIIHGMGFCSSCKKAEFQYYHYINDNRVPLKLLSLEGF
jgi:hypothetical protein